MQTVKPKKLVAMLISLVMLISLIPNVAFADSWSDYIEDFNYSVSNGVLTVSFKNKVAHVNQKCYIVVRNAMETYEYDTFLNAKNQFLYTTIYKHFENSDDTTNVVTFTSTELAFGEDIRREFWDGMNGGEENNLGGTYDTIFPSGSTDETLLNKYKEILGTDYDTLDFEYMKAPSHSYRIEVWTDQGNVANIYKEKTFTLDDDGNEVDTTSYTVKYDVNGGTSDASLMEQTWQYATAPDKAGVTTHSYTGTKTDSVFKGWSTKANPTASDTIYAAGSKYKPNKADANGSGEITLYAVWKTQATIKFEPGEGASGSITESNVYAEGDEYTLPESAGLTAPADKHLFNGWLVNGTTKQPGSKITLGATNTITAQWVDRYPATVSTTALTVDYGTTITDDMIKDKITITVPSGADKSKINIYRESLPTNAGSYSCGMKYDDGTYMAEFNLSITINKINADKPTIAEASNITTSSFDTTITAGAKYMVVKASDPAPTAGSGDWKTATGSSETITGLLENTEYKIYAYTAGDNNHNDSAMETKSVTTATVGGNTLTVSSDKSMVAYGDTFTIAAQTINGTGAITFEENPANATRVSVAGDGKSATYKATNSTGTVKVKVTQVADASIGAKTAYGPEMNLSKRELTVAVGTLTVADKVYDGTKTASTTGDLALSNIVEGDDVSIDTITGEFASANASDTAQAVTITATLKGAKASHYELGEMPSTLTAKITPRPINVSLKENKTKTQGEALTLTAADLEAQATDTDANKGLAPGKDISDLGITEITCAGCATDAAVGEYPITAVTGNANYTITVTGDKKVIVSEADGTVHNFTVSYNANGGTGTMATQTGVVGSSVTLASNTFTNSGYAFAGWALSSTATVAEYADKASVTFTVDNDGNAIAQDSNVTLYAVWKPTHTITFVANGGRMDTTSVTAAEGDTINLSSYKPTYSGYTFNGWYTSSSFTATSKVTSVTLDADVTLYAKWTKKQTYSSGGGGGGGSYSCRVKFMTNGGYTMDSVNVGYGSTLTKPENPVKTGYIFKGWYTDTALTQPYDFSSKVTKSMTLYAAWEKADDASQIIFTIGDCNALVFGEVKTNDVAPFIVNDRTMLPARFVAENMGADVAWDEENEIVTITGKNVRTGEDVVIVITIGSDVAYVNGEAIALDSSAFIENDRTYTPVRFVAESLGADVEWTEESETVTITARF